MTAICKTCRYFSETYTPHDTNNKRGKCSRFPEHVTVTMEHFCGEWAQVVAQAAPKEKPIEKPAAKPAAKKTRTSKQTKGESDV